jgi:uncharacterized linocin/CFP29 family protein
MSGMGSVAQQLLASGFDFGTLRKYIGKDGRSYQTVTNRQTGKPEVQLVQNNMASLRFQDWRRIDEAVIRVSKPPMKFISAVRGAGLEYGLADAFGTTVFSYEDMSDISAATMSMDAIRRADSDRPVFSIKNLPIPIIHKDFSIPLRQVAASQRGNTPLDTALAEQAAERVAEYAEQLALGVLPSWSYAASGTGGTIYGLTNFNQRLTKTLTAPTTGGWTPHTLVQEVEAMVLQLKNAYQRGPYLAFASINWDPYLDDDYSSAKGDNTLRERIERIREIGAVETVDYFNFLTGNPYTFTLLRADQRVFRLVVGMDITTMQWQSPDGLEMYFKVMAILVPQFRADQNGNTGLNHGSAASA